MARSTHSAVADPRNADVQIFVNGEFFHRSEAKISVFDSGFLVGDGIWEGLRLHHGQFAFLDRHLDRLMQAAATTDLAVPSRDELAAALLATVERNGMADDVHVRLMITRGDKSTPSQHPSNCVGGPNIVIIAEHKRADPSVTADGISLFTATVRRPPPDTLDQRLNCHSKLHEVIALIQATKAGADEALMLDPTGAVATCNATNFFVVRDDEVWTSTGHYNLHGITRAVVLEVARDHGLVTHEAPFSLTDVYGADEAFVTGTFGGLTPVREVDGRAIGHGRGQGPVTTRLAGWYREAIDADVKARFGEVAGS
jgi:branched-chain amino acid aminotransferase